MLFSFSYIIAQFRKKKEIMKNTISIFSIALFLLLNASVFGQGINNNNNLWDEIIKQAKTENKLIMLDAYESWCGPYTFDDDELITFLNENFICVQINREGDEGKKFVSRYRLKAYPSILFIDGNGNIFHEQPGTFKISQFLELSKKVLKDYKSEIGEEQINKDVKSICNACGLRVDKTVNFCSNCGEQFVFQKEIDPEYEQDYPITIEIDLRDGLKQYNTMKFGKNQWFVKNLNFKTENSVCYHNKPENCKKYGQLYTYEEALNACPNGWHLATEDDWNELIEANGGTENAGKNLRSTSDIDGFAASSGGSLSGGDSESENDDYFVNIDKISSYWAKSCEEGTYFYSWTNESSINKSTRTFKSEKHSVRCVYRTRK